MTPILCDFHACHMSMCQCANYLDWFFAKLEGVFCPILEEDPEQTFDDVFTWPF